MSFRLEHLSTNDETRLVVYTVVFAQFNTTGNETGNHRKYKTVPIIIKTETFASTINPAASFESKFFFSSEISLTERHCIADPSSIAFAQTFTFHQITLRSSSSLTLVANMSTVSLDY